MPSDRNGKNVKTTECKSKLGNVISTINNPLFAVDGIRLLSLASDFAVVIEEIDIELWIQSNKLEESMLPRQIQNKWNRILKMRLEWNIIKNKSNLIVYELLTTFERINLSWIKLFSFIEFVSLHLFVIFSHDLQNRSYIIWIVLMFLDSVSPFKLTASLRSKRIGLLYICAFSCHFSHFCVKTQCNNNVFVRST